MHSFSAELEHFEIIHSTYGESAWKSTDISKIVEIARKHHRVILGGDIISTQGEYTYDNWYYNQDSLLSISDNVSQSAEKCLMYLETISNKYTDGYAVILVFALPRGHGGSSVVPSGETDDPET